MPDVVKVAAPPGCLSIAVDGVRYPVRDGHAVVRDAEYAPQLLRVADAIRGDLTTYRGVSGRVCCRRTMWAWEAECPRCGGDRA